MNKLCYSVEKRKNTITILNIIFFIGAIWYSMYEIIVEKEESSGYIALLCLMLGLELFYILFFLRPSIKTKLKYKNIKKNGQKYKGYIESFNYEKYQDIHSSNANKTRYRYILLIKYGENSVLKTPEIAFNPVRDLGSRECDIYVLGNEVYATGFVKRKINENIIWDEDDESVLRLKEIKKNIYKENKLGIIFAIAFVIGLFLIVLTQILELFK